ncbi:unnamed protein product, partial [Rotaria magnacalcarata]
FIPVITTCYDDTIKDHSGSAASTVFLDNQAHEASLKLCDELRPNLILTTGGTGSSTNDITPETSSSSSGMLRFYLALRHATDLIQNRRTETSTSLMEGQCLEEKSVRIIFKCSLNQDIRFADLGLLTTVEPRRIRVYDKLRVVVLSTDSGKNGDSNKIMLMKFNQPIDYLYLRPEYIRVIVIEWSTKSLIFIARIISANSQRSLLSARRCEGLDGYSQQVDWFKLSVQY